MTLHTSRTRVRLASFASLLALAGSVVPRLRSGADEPPARPGAFAVTIEVDASRPKGPLQPPWGFFAADEPNYAYMKDGKTLIAELGRLRPGSVYFRTHNLLTSG